MIYILPEELIQLIYKFYFSKYVLPDINKIKIPTDQFILENDDYMWLNILNGEKNVHTLTRDSLNKWAINYGINPYKYKNKKLLVQGMMQLWEKYFSENSTFKKEYDIKYEGPTSQIRMEININ